MNSRGSQTADSDRNASTRRKLLLSLTATIALPLSWTAPAIAATS